MAGVSPAITSHTRRPGSVEESAGKAGGLELRECR